MNAAVVVFAVGNPSRGDDAVGPELCGRLEKWLKNEGLEDQIELIEDFQLQIEHVLDLQGRRLALFIDAGENTPAPYTFQQIAPATGIAHTTHELPLETVLQTYQQAESSHPPPPFVHSESGEKFELGEPLTAIASMHVETAFVLLMQLCRMATLAEWKKAAVG